MTQQIKPVPYEIDPSLTLKENVRRLGLSQGLKSYSKIARHADLSYATIVRLDKGRQPRRMTYEKIAEAFDVDIDELMSLSYH